MTKKVIARLFGGLGNQLFIYATARALAERTKADLLLDIRSGFASDLFERQFALHHFDVHFQEARGAWAFDMPLGKGVRYLSRNLNRLMPPLFRFHLSDFWESPKKHNASLNTKKIPPVVWMEGYWQSPVYFDPIRQLLLQEISVKTPVSVETNRIGREIRQNKGICMHLRMLRNYIKGIEMSNYNQMDIQHYLNCMDYIAQRVENPHFYCFSDNPDVMESIVKTNHVVTFVTHNRGDRLAHEDFYLMSQCRHFILSNSTFGWWPAWLSPYADSMVITPPLNYWDNQDILPEHWLTSDQVSTVSTDAF